MLIAVAAESSGKDASEMEEKIADLEEELAELKSDNKDLENNNNVRQHDQLISIRGRGGGGLKIQFVTNFCKKNVFFSGF